MFAVGDVVGTYTVLLHLRSGGMADLYLARRDGAAGFRRLVAIKVIHPRHAQDEQVIRMFLDEARISARIDHPNVVHVEDLGQLDETYFLVMEYVHGCSLAQLLSSLGEKRRRLSPVVAVAVAARVAEGLHAAHETTDDEGRLVGLVHRDVSPQNILLSHKGHVKLIDFGVAKARLRSEETNVAMLKGKVRYMPPEQATTGLVDRRSDVYSLGIVLWEMLTMRRLFTGKTEFEVLLKVRDPKVPPPSTYVPDVPPALDEVVLAALAPRPRRPAAERQGVPADAGERAAGGDDARQRPPRGPLALGGGRRARRDAAHAPRGDLAGAAGRAAARRRPRAGGARGQRGGRVARREEHRRGHDGALGPRAVRGGRARPHAGRGDALRHARLPHGAREPGGARALRRDAGGGGGPLGRGGGPDGGGDAPHARALGRRGRADAAHRGRRADRAPGGAGGRAGDGPPAGRARDLPDPRPRPSLARVAPYAVALVVSVLVGVAIALALPALRGGEEVEAPPPVQRAATPAPVTPVVATASPETVSNAVPSVGTPVSESSPTGVPREAALVDAGPPTPARSGLRAGSARGVGASAASADHEASVSQ
ncbi:MAG: protein kinase [Sandaracinaceae bacterium]|nr:protein kinase [Sandaracinaceae bacterium]